VRWINGTAEQDQLVRRAGRVRPPSERARRHLASGTDSEESSSSTYASPLGSIALVHAQGVVGHRGRRREPHQRTTQTGTCTAGAYKNA
jgi:hypothetical protein